MAANFTKQDLEFILESLQYSKIKFENYEYPSYDLKQQRIKEAEAVINKVKKSLKELAA